jgi:pyridoxal biosynthesis lyase PdxS
MVHTETSRDEGYARAIVEAATHYEEYASIARLSKIPRTGHEKTGHVFSDGG